MIKRIAILGLLLVAAGTAGGQRNTCTCDVTKPYQAPVEDHCHQKTCKCVCRLKTKFPTDCMPKNGRHCHCAKKGSEKHD